MKVSTKENVLTIHTGLTVAGYNKMVDEKSKAVVVRDCETDREIYRVSQGEVASINRFGLTANVVEKKELVVVIIDNKCKTQADFKAKYGQDIAFAAKVLPRIGRSIKNLEADIDAAFSEDDNADLVTEFPIPTEEVTDGEQDGEDTPDAE